MFTLEEVNAIIKAALADIASGMIKNASGYTGPQLANHLSESFDTLIELGNAARKTAAEKFSDCD